MFTKIETDEILTEEEANKRYYPNSYIMVECSREGYILKGRVIAFAPLNELPALSEYANELYRAGKHGHVTLTNTKDPFEGRTLYYEIRCVKE